MGFSVNTNVGAMVALQNLDTTNRNLNMVQSRISTGFKVAGAKDNGAIFAIAQNMRSDVAGLNAVKQSLSNGVSVSDVAVAAGEAVSDLLIEMKEKAVAATEKTRTPHPRRPSTSATAPLYSTVATANPMEEKPSA